MLVKRLLGSHNMISRRLLFSQYRWGIIFECSRAFGIWGASLCILLHLITGERALSKDTDSGTWHLTFQLQTEETAPYLEKSTSKSETVTLLIGTQSYEFREPDTTTLYTTKSKTKVELYHRTKEHLEMPMHAVVWFLNSEMVNRHGLCRAEEAINLSTAESTCSRFELESLFRLSHPQATQLFENQKTNIERNRVEGMLRFEHDGKEVVAFKGSEHELSYKHKQTFRRFLAHTCRIHPEIRQAIVSEGRVPMFLSFQSRDDREQTREIYRLESAMFDPAEHVVEIPSEYVPRVNDKQLEPILNRLQQFSIPDKLALRKQAEEMIDKALASHHVDEAVLAALRFLEITDNKDAYQQLLQRCGGLGNRDVRRMVYRLRDLQQIKEAKHTLESNQSKIAYLTNYYLADAAMMDRRYDEPIKENLLACLEADPLIVGAYVDLWRFYLIEWDPYTAWRCIRAAERIMPNHGVLIPLRNMEKQIEIDNPEFF